jgi:hypothetical protein
MFFVCLVLAAALTYAVATGVFLSKLVDRDVAVEMFKAIIQVDGFLIGFAGVLATFVLAEVGRRSIAFSVSQPHRIYVLASLFLSASFLLLSIMFSLSGMSGLHDNLLVDSREFFVPLYFLIDGVCFLCVVASGAVVREP